jgi:beta-glucosidase
MPNPKSLKPLLLFAVGFLVGPACTLPAPTPKPHPDASPPPTCNSDDDGYPRVPNGVDGGSAINSEFTPVALCNGGPGDPKVEFKYAPGYQQNKDDLQNVESTISKMSLWDVATQMRGMPYGVGVSTQINDIQRSKDTATIRGYRYRDASRGMNLGEDMEGVKPNSGEKIDGAQVGFSTAFPVSMARGAAFDIDLEYAVGEAIGDELQAAGQSLLLAPCMNILRHPLWGRTQETYGEDSYHIGRLATAMTVGIQQHIAANAKHYMAYNIENDRPNNNSTLDEQTLREIYARHFRMVIQDGGVASVMASYNKVNNIKATQNGHILTDVLRTDFGFKGFILSDWWAMPNDDPTKADPATRRSTAIQAVQAGLDVELPWSFNFGQLESIVNSNAGLTRADLEVAAKRVLEQKFRFNSTAIGNKVGLGSPITTYKNGRIGGCDQVHINLARRAALESMVLLKNDNTTLPINSSVKKVAVLGAIVDYVANDGGGSTGGTINFATSVHTGDKGSSRVFHDPAKGIGPFDGIKKIATQMGLSEDSVVHGSSLADIGGGPDVDFFIVVAGLTPQDEGEIYTKAGDRVSFALDAKQPAAKQTVQNDLIKSVAALKKPMVVMLEGGSVIDISPWLNDVPAVVMAWYPGMVGGEAMGKLLWGQVNFSGKLPFTWGAALSQYAQFSGANGTTQADYYLGYRYFENSQITPLFKYGYGLSYTKFAYKDLQLGCGTLSEGSILPVTVTVQNTGSVAGDEIALLFVSFPNTSARRGPRELKGFARVSNLNPGEERQVTIPVRLADLDYFDTAQNKWIVESGKVNIMVGGSLENLPLQGSVDVTGYEVKPQGSK